MPTPQPPTRAGDPQQVALIERRSTSVWTADQVKEYIERILQEHNQATLKAERERELAASALREGLYQSITDGDERLREHVLNQVQQIQTALTSSEALEQQRIANASLQVEALRKEMLLLHEASEKAIAKAEAAYEKRFESVNEFRAQLGDQVAQFFPREVAESQFSQMNQRLSQLEGLHRESTGRAQGVTQARTGMDAFTGKLIALGGLLVAVIAVAVTIIAIVN